MLDSSSSGRGVARIVVTVPGPDLDIAAAPALHSMLSALASNGPETVVVDLSAVTFMDCAGLGPLVAALGRFPSGPLLRGVRPKVARLLQLTDLMPLFRIEEIHEAAAPGRFPAPPEDRVHPPVQVAEVEAPGPVSRSRQRDSR